MTAAAKSIDSYINKERAPYGVIFDGQSKAYVGSQHGQQITLSDNLKRRLRMLSDKYGVWFEGDGKDVVPNKTLFGDKSSYRGSWDDALTGSVTSYPHYFLSALFGNVDVNGQAKAFLDPNISIFDSLIKHQKGMRYFKDRAYGPETLAEFLKACSDQKYNFFTMSKDKATAKNLTLFLKAGESRMFPSNWQQYPYNAGKVMKKFEDARNQFILDQSSGVYVLGAGHLVELLRMKRTLKMIGGEKASA